jgi:hypothetical protein
LLCVRNFGDTDCCCILPCLQLLGLSSVAKLTRAEWALLRGSFGRPRRLSLGFLKEERTKLESFRWAGGGAGRCNLVLQVLPVVMGMRRQMLGRPAVTCMFAFLLSQEDV